MFKKLGVQLYTIRDFMDTPENVRASFKRLKSLGYDEAQTAGSQIPYEEFAGIAKEEGIDIIGTHENFDRMVNDFDEAVRIQQLLGARYMGIGGRGLMTEEKVNEFIIQANEIAKKLVPYDMKFTFHHHGHEFIKYKDGKTYMDTLVEGLDKENISFCLDTYWIQNGGADVRYWIEKLNSRVDILHLKDMKKLPVEGQLQATHYAAIGEGNMWWEGILESAEKIGVKHYVVEKDFSSDPFASLESSSNFLHKNFMK
ncbi:MAG: sugar phosphate isomerase/epimerase [Clostridia bacterium]|nr:sugar phosphate isomerase/epimerase [Clostridia bacterium]